MKPEYRSKFMELLKVAFPLEFPTVEMKANNVNGVTFESEDFRVWFFKVDVPDNIEIAFEVIDDETHEWDDYTTWGDETDLALKKILERVYDESHPQQPLQSMRIKRSEIGWSDPITAESIKQGDEIVRLQKDNRFIFARKGIEEWWKGRPQKNPMTNLPVGANQIERFTADIEEDAGDEPMDGGRRRKRLRRKTMRRKNLRSTRKRK